MPIRRKFPSAGAPSAAPIPPPSERAEAHAPTKRRAPARDEDNVALRLAIGRSGVGIELARSAHLGCLLVTELTATLPGMRFPLDVSGGVPKFRHRRGVLQALHVELGGRALERWAAPRLRGRVDAARTPDVWVGVRSSGVTVCVTAAGDTSECRTSNGPPVVAFDIEAIAEASDLVLIVHGARGTDLPAPATAIAIACTEAMLRGVATREGAVFVVAGGAAALARALMPQDGARVPDAEGLGWTVMRAQADTWAFHATRGALTAEPTEHALRAREIATILREGDDALVGEM